MQKEPARHRVSKEEEHESVKNYRLVFENASDAIFVLHERQIRFANRRTHQLLGCRREKLLGAPFLDFVFPDDQKMLAVYYGTSGGRRHELESCTFRIVNHAGERLWVQAAIVPVIWQGQPARLHFLRNFSRLKRLEEQLRKVQDRESVHTLVCGFDHLLMGILGNVSLALVDIAPSDPAYQRIGNIEKYVRRCVYLTRQLLEPVQVTANGVFPTALEKDDAADLPA